MSSTGVQLLVFDSRRGNLEGQEIQKILAFHPAETPEVEQITTAGLLHGLLLFSSNFCQDCWEVAETDRCTWVVHQAEPSIWLALAAPRAWVPRHCTQSNLRAVLLQSYQIIRLLHGPIEGLLQQDGSGQQAKRAILPVLEHLGHQLGNRASWQHRQLRNPLADVALAPMLRLSPATSLAIQNFSNGLQLVSLGRGGGSRGVEGVVLLYQLHMVWSSLAPEDTAAIYSLASTALLHPQSAGQRGTACEASQPNMLDSCCWHQLPSKYVVLRPGCLRSPRQQEHLLPSSPSLSGQLSPSPSLPLPTSQQQRQQPQADGGPSEELASIPVVQIQGGQERCHLLPYKEGKLWVLLLVSASVHMTQQTLAALQAAMGSPSQQLAAQVGLEVRNMGAEPAHLPGYRYLFCDQASQSCVATPRVKISAMLHHSRALAATVRESLSLLEPSHRTGSSTQGARGGSSGGDGWCIGEEGVAATEAGQQEGSGLPGDPSAWVPGTEEAPGSGLRLAGGQPHGMDSVTGHASHAGAEPAAAAAIAAAAGLPTGNGSAEPQETPGSSNSTDSRGSSRAVPADELEAQGNVTVASEEAAGEVQKLPTGDASAALSTGAAETQGQPHGPTTSPPGLPSGTGPEEGGATKAGGAAAGPPTEGATALLGDPSPSRTAPAGAALPLLPPLPGVVNNAAVAGPMGAPAGSSACCADVATPPPAVGANEVHEVLVRSSQDCWAEARVASRWGRQLLVVRERKSEKTLGEAVAVMDAFADSFMC